MARKGQEIVLLLDVGPRMHPHLAHAARALADLLTSKMWHRPRDEAALFLYGSSTTRNAVAEEMAAAGEEGQYEGIEELHPMGPPDGQYLRTLHSVQPGDGRADWFDALAVAAAALKARGHTTAEKSIVVLSNFCERVEVEPDDVSDLAGRLQQMGVRLELAKLYCAEDEEWEVDRAHNLNLLAAMCTELDHTEREVAAPVDLLGVFRAHEVGATTTFAGVLQVTKNVAVQVKMSGKTKQEKFPGPATETEAQAEQGLVEGGVGGLQRAKLFKYVDEEMDQNVEIPDEDVIGAYKYGANIVPVPDNEKEDYAFPRDKGLLLLGFVDAEGEQALPRHYYMTDTRVLVADKAWDASGVAFAALVTAMLNQGQHAVLRLVRTARERPQLCIAAPVAASGAAPAHLLVNVLPFMEDFRDYKFPSFTKKSWVPSEEQLEAARGLVLAMSLGPPQEQLAPEGTPYPQVHRLYYELGRRFVSGGDEPLQDEDPLFEHVFAPRWGTMPGAEAAAAAAREAFPMGQAAKASRRSRRLIGSDAPLADFESLLLDAGPEEACSALAEVIPEIVMGSMGESKFDQAAELVERLREVCVTHELPAVFNALLCALYGRLKDDPVKKPFWRKLENRGVQPIDRTEVEASQMEPEAASQFFSQRHFTD
ncbi:ATP-dependent DNA helicase 2 subunit KU80 [Chlorella sorokiniana]|uniref:ATP-dependent DNA helicase 2 subunit KU80 n=1 Tax=Chlorella sorokiniana TaxID=3076 RepID=A0A2P6TNA5_CHLSO|nr:ATP-dependent DNA helicase 2 subunit KU80 [Chlorella sorokiniana]|eukprot:PRW50808.1 ATP-dependent DNA helicase 2 subunit KU80 [Chlorella sorokiniana]